MKQEERMDKESLEAAMGTERFGRKVYYREEVDSTNTEGKRLAERMGAQGIEFHGSLVIAEKQTMGKGRRGRGWSSPKGEGIWMTLLLKPKIKPETAPMLTLVAAISVAQAIQSCTGLEASIKWPNDIVVNRKKVCGILTEMSSQPGQIHYVAVGIGINVNIQAFPEAIRETATSLWIEKSREWELARKSQGGLPLEGWGNGQEARASIPRIGLVAEVMEKMEKIYGKFLQAEDFSLLMESYNQLLANRGRQAQVHGEQGSFQGTALGVDRKGRLLVETEEGVQAVQSGEVSVRGLYGYV